MRAASPEVAINLAAYTNVDGAESDVVGAHAVNASGAGNVARAAAAVGAWTIHVSTDYVFDGSKRTPYVESDDTGPQSVYGASKLAGEVAIKQAAPDRHTTIRSSWLFGVNGPCFPATMLRLAEERAELTVVEDQVGCPTFTPHLARAILEIVVDPDRRAALAGTIHVAAAGECSWFQFAGEIMRSAGASTAITPGSTAELGRPAPRPAYSVLRTERGDAVPVLPEWNEGLAAYLSARGAGG